MAAADLQHMRTIYQKITPLSDLDALPTPEHTGHEHFSKCPDVALGATGMVQVGVGQIRGVSTGKLLWLKIRTRILPKLLPHTDPSCLIDCNKIRLTSLFFCYEILF
jgi:hypothetical protein